MNSYKLILIIFPLVFVLQLSSCKKLTQFEMDYEQTFNFESSSPVSVPFNISIPPQETNSTSEFEENDTRKNKIEEILLTKMYIEIIDPPEKSLSFLNEIEVFINADGLDELSLAIKEDIPSNIGNYLELDTSNENFDEYIKKDTFSLRIRTIYDEYVLEDLEAKCFMTFFVDAKVV